MVHLGDHNRGHFTAYRQVFPLERSKEKKVMTQYSEVAAKVSQNPSRSWYYFSDHHVTPAKQDEILSSSTVLSNSYMLFYEREESRQPQQ